MEMKTNMIYRERFIPDWDSDMEEFFNYAVAHLRKYSERRGFPDWKCADPEIFEYANAFCIRFFLPGLKPESINAEAVEHVIILSGLRWCRQPKEQGTKLVPFRRVVEVSASIRENNWSISWMENGTVRLIVRKSKSSDGHSANLTVNGNRKTLSRRRNGAAEATRNQPLTSFYTAINGNPSRKPP